MFDSDIILHNAGNHSFCAGGQFLWFSVIGEVRVVRMDNGWLAQDEVAPFVEAAVESGQFFVVNIVVHFLFGEGFRVVTQWFGFSF